MWTNESNALKSKAITQKKMFNDYFIKNYSIRAYFYLPS
jgi:hypothetical protein